MRRCCGLGVRKGYREERKLWMGPRERRGEGPGAPERSASSDLQLARGAWLLWCRQVGWARAVGRRR